MNCRDTLNILFNKIFIIRLIQNKTKTKKKKIAKQTLKKLFSGIKMKLEKKELTLIMVLSSSLVCVIVI